MGIEIERKFLVVGDAWREEGRGVLIRQGYLSMDPGRTVRVRIGGQQAFLTIKAKSRGISRREYEYGLPLEEAEEMLVELCLKPLIEKVRTRIDFGGHTWEVDEFLGFLKGLVVAEVELEDTEEEVELPPWIGREVSGDPRYYNSQLVRMGSIPMPNE